MSTAFPKDTQIGNPNLPVYAQETQKTVLPANVHTFDPFFGYLGEVPSGIYTSQVLPRGSINGVKQSPHNPGDPNL